MSPKLGNEAKGISQFQPLLSTYWVEWISLSISLSLSLLFSLETSCCFVLRSERRHARLHHINSLSLSLSLSHTHTQRRFVCFVFFEGKGRGKERRGEGWEWESEAVVSCSYLLFPRPASRALPCPRTWPSPQPTVCSPWRQRRCLKCDVFR